MYEANHQPALNDLSLLPALSFTISSSVSSQFSPRVGRLVLKRPTVRDVEEILLAGIANNNSEINIATPGFMTMTSRGVVPHLSRDHCIATDAVSWVHVPFETFLEHNPPVPVLYSTFKSNDRTQHHATPLQDFLGYSPSRQLLSLSLRDPYDNREMPPNGASHVAAHCMRGVRKVTTTAWRTYVEATRPDIVFALADTPFTPPPYSQKRITKSIERSAAWLMDLLRPIRQWNIEPSSPALPLSHSHPFNVFVTMAGSTSIAARQAFAYALMETLYGKEAEAVKPLTCLDDGVAGYAFDLTPLRTALAANRYPNGTASDESDKGKNMTTTMPPLLHASLAPLPVDKLRVVTAVSSLHEILHLIRDVGIDVFDGKLAQEAANTGIAFDFRFPVPKSHLETDENTHLSTPADNTKERMLLRMRTGGKLDFGHNLYDHVYARDFSTLAGSFSARASSATAPTLPICPCIACSPVIPSSHIPHSAVDNLSYQQSVEGETDHRETTLPPYTRAYLHHLLHTHEMSAHTLLAAHNLTVLHAFFKGVRQVLKKNDDGESGSVFVREVERFTNVYDEGTALLSEAKKEWRNVDLARGRGRLAREREKEKEENMLFPQSAPEPVCEMLRDVGLGPS